MPFCPKCKVEYREGFSVCADCKIPLVDSLDDIIDEEIIEEVEEESEDNQVEVTMSEVIEVSDDEYSTETVIPEIEFVPYNQEAYDNADEAKQEANRVKAAIENNKEEQKRFKAKQYVTKKQLASEYKSSGFMLVIIGGLGFTFVLLLMLGVFPFRPRGIVSYVIDGLLCAFFAMFVYFGINSFVRYAQVSKTSDDEKDTDKDFEEWFLKTFTKSFVDSDLNLIEDDTANYFMRNAKIKYIIAQNYPDLREDFVDMIIDKHYGEIFE